MSLYDVPYTGVKARPFESQPKLRGIHHDRSVHDVVAGTVGGQIDYYNMYESGIPTKYITPWYVKVDPVEERQRLAALRKRNRADAHEMLAIMAQRHQLWIDCVGRIYDEARSKWSLSRKSFYKLVLYESLEGKLNDLRLRIQARKEEMP